MELHERLDLFLARLQAAPACRTAEEALTLVCRLIEEVEDEFCSLPREEPPPMHFTGRMYAPRGDYVRKMENGELIATTRHHRVYCRMDGSIDLVHIPTKQNVIEKPGKSDEHTH